MANSWSQKLRVLQSERKATIVCSVAPHNGEEVEFAPRYTTDREPWVLKADPDSYRYSGRECHPVYPKKGDDGDSA